VKTLGGRGTAAIYPTISECEWALNALMLHPTPYDPDYVEGLYSDYTCSDYDPDQAQPEKCSFGVPTGHLLGYLISERGIEGNPEKIQAIINMQLLKTLRHVQQLTGRLAALSRFISKLGKKALPFYRLLRKMDNFTWIEEAQAAFDDLKRCLSTSPVLVTPREKEPMLLYIAATNQVVSSALVVERAVYSKEHGVQTPVYCNIPDLQY
jgi:hypothetical protein